jgi:hypothetical protein
MQMGFRGTDLARRATMALRDAQDLKESDLAIVGMATATAEGSGTS